MSDSIRKLVFLRHGITAPQEEGRCCGHFDPELSVRGREQLTRVGAVIRCLRPSHVWSSDLRRCTETASLLFPLMPCRCLPELREIAFGDFEGRLWTEIAPRLDSIMLDPNCCFPGGESLRIFANRVTSGIRRVLAEPGETAVMVAHGGSIAVAALMLLHRPLSDLWSFHLPHAGRAIFERRSESWIVAESDWSNGTGNPWPA